MLGPADALQSAVRGVDVFRSGAHTVAHLVDDDLLQMDLLALIRRDGAEPRQTLAQLVEVLVEVLVVELELLQSLTDLGGRDLSQSWNLVLKRNFVCCRISPAGRSDK